MFIELLSLDDPQTFAVKKFIGSTYYKKPQSQWEVLKVKYIKSIKN